MFLQSITQYPMNNKKHLKWNYLEVQGKKKGGQRLENRPKKTGNDSINFR